MKELFITGGADFIATSLIKRLIAANEIVYDNLSRSTLKEFRPPDHYNLEVIQRGIS